MTSSSKNILWFSFRQRHLNKYQPYFSNSSNHFSHSMITIKPKQINLSLLSRYIKSYWIYVKGNYETKFIKKGKERYKMICSKVDDLYILNLYSEAEYEEGMGNMEFSVIYEFKIINQKLKLIDIQLAG